MPRSRVRKSTSVAPPVPVQQHGVGVAVDAFRRILRALRLASLQTQAAAGISAAQLYVLQVVGDGMAASLSQIATRTMTDRTSVAAVVKRLVSAELVSREPSQVDRRQASVRITAKGRAVLRRAPVSPTGRLVAGLDALDNRTLASLATGLEALTAAMGLSDQRAGMLFEDGEETRRGTARSRAQALAGPRSKRGRS